MRPVPGKRGVLQPSEDMVRNMPLLDFHHHGHITQDEEREIRHILDECYQRLGRWLPEKV